MEAMKMFYASGPKTTNRAGHELYAADRKYKVTMHPQ